MTAFIIFCPSFQRSQCTFTPSVFVYIGRIENASGHDPTFSSVRVGSRQRRWGISPLAPHLFIWYLCWWWAKERRMGNTTTPVPLLIHRPSRCGEGAYNRLLQMKEVQSRHITIGRYSQRFPPYEGGVSSGRVDMRESKAGWIAWGYSLTKLHKRTKAWLFPEASSSSESREVYFMLPWRETWRAVAWGLDSQDSRWFTLPPSFGSCVWTQWNC